MSEHDHDRTNEEGDIAALAFVKVLERTIAMDDSICPACLMQTVIMRLMSVQIGNMNEEERSEYAENLVQVAYDRLPESVTQKYRIH